MNNTVNQEEFVPHWAKTVVWYQIFPDRFYNGDQSNDPTLANIKGSWPHDEKSPWQIHPWTADWYKLQSYESKNGKDIWHNIQRRRYGGDLQGIIDKLDYLQDLGITALYLNPIFEAPSLHKYDGATYHHVDPNFGPNPAGDRQLITKEIPSDPSTWVWTAADSLFLQLVQEVHRRGMRIIIDGVFNHMGINSWAFRDVVKNQQNSKYKDWFTIKSWDDPEKGTEFDYEGWFGVRELPELREDKNGIVAGPKKYIFDITRRWMDPDGDGNPADGIDGWRLDVAFCVKHEFWKDWRKHVKSINPAAYLTAEIVQPPEAVQPYLAGDEFDGDMNYNFAFAVADYFIAEKTRITTSQFDTLLARLRTAHPNGVAYVQQNLMDSHDSNRLASHIVNRDLGRYRDWGSYFNRSKGDNPQYNTRKPTKEEYEIQKLVALFQMTNVGAPMIYYGDEAGMWGANDPCCRKPMVWEEFEYDPEQTKPDQNPKPHSDVVKVNSNLHDTYRKLIHLRNNHPALQLGNYTTVLVDDEKQLYGFSRSYQDESILVLINNTTKKQTAVIADSVGSFTDVLNGNKKYDSDTGPLRVELLPRWGAVLVAAQPDSSG